MAKTKNREGKRYIQVRAAGDDVFDVKGFITSAGGNLTPVVLDPTTVLGSIERVRITGSATPETATAVLDPSHAQVFLDAGADQGGFELRIRFGISTAKATGRGFLGLSAAPTAGFAGSANPSAQTNIIGLGWDAGDSTLQFMRNDGTGTATKVNTGFAKAATRNLYELTVAADAGGGQSVVMSLRDIVNGADATNNGRAYTTNLPANQTALGTRIWISSGTGAGAWSIDLSSVYLEN